MFHLCYHCFSVHGMLRRHHFEWYTKYVVVGVVIGHNPVAKLKIVKLFSWQVLWVIAKIYDSHKMVFV